MVANSSRDSAATTPGPDCDPLPSEELAAHADWQSDLDQLYRRRAGGLIEHFARGFRDKDRAVDIVQEAFARFAALSWPRRSSIAKPDAYLYRICANLFRDSGRSALLAEQASAGGGWLDHETHDAIALLESRDTLRRLEAAMLRLKPKTREIFMAHRLDGLSYAEIAARTGLSVKGVEKQMSKAIAKVDRMLDRA